MMDFPNLSSQVSTVAILITADTPELLGDLTGRTIIADFSIRTFGGPTFFLHTATPGLPPNVRLFFSSTPPPYVVSQANANEAAYWWADFAWVPLRSGAFRLQASLSPEVWSDALGHYGNDPAYSQAFYDAVANVRQIGFSFGGGSFFDVGVGVINPRTSATFRIIRYQLTPRIYRGTVNHYGNPIHTGADATAIRD